MLLTRLRERSVVVVGGKGGVGKTTISSALALACAREGRRVLLVSSDPAHSLGHLWGREIGDGGALLHPGLHALEIDPRATTQRHLQAVATTLRRLMPEHLQDQIEPHLEMVRNAPGTYESAVLDRLAEVVLEESREVDLVVLDTAPTGHTTRLLALPQTMTLWSQALLTRRERSGRFGDAARRLGHARGRDSRRRDEELMEILARRTHRLRALGERLTDPAHALFIAVTIAEPLAVQETCALAEQLHTDRIPLGALVVNRRAPADSGPVLLRAHRREEASVAELHAALPDVPSVEVPLLPLREEAIDMLGDIGNLLAASPARRPGGC